MQRYFIKERITDEITIRDANQVHHIRNVMRRQKGDQAVVCDDQGHCFYMKIERIESDSVVFSKGQALPKLNRKFHVTLAQSLIRKDHFELACQKATELGVDTIIPIETERTIIKLKDPQVEKKLTRWQAIAQEASEQSQRNTVSKIAPLMHLSALDFSLYDTVLVAYENEKTVTLKTALSVVNKDSKLLLIVGPEGGFTAAEIAFLERHGAQTVSLGPRILRSETAAIYLLCALSYELEMNRS